MQLNGIHHVTSVNAKIAGKLKFYYTEVLGLRLVKKSVNQDDVSAYHLYYTDKTGSPDGHDIFRPATGGPGFSIDEDPDALGEKLILPACLENPRQQIEAGLTSIGA